MLLTATTMYLRWTPRQASKAGRIIQPTCLRSLHSPPLVFMGDSTGLFYAASAATGEILWVFDASTVPNAGGATASAAVYEIDGVEYVVYGFGGDPGFGSFTQGDA